MEGAHRAALLSEPGRVAAHALFFPAAAAYAALVLPASVLAMLGIVPALPGSGFAAGHAHEMLFGFALAVVAGDQLGPTNPRVLALLFGSWIAARAAVLFAPYGIATALANAAFATLLAARLVPRLFASAKKLRNRALPFVLAALCACALAIQIALQLGSAGTQHGVLMVAIVLIGLLMLFMGGRIIAPAAAGQLHAQGGNLGARVQPRLEGWLIVLMLAAAAAIAVGAASPGGIALVGAGALAAARLARWRLWALRGRPDILCLGAGYAWLALGLIALGAALLAGKHVVAALHLITVGSLGTLTLSVMALTWARLARRDPARMRLPVWGTVLIAAATTARVAADFGIAEPHALLILAAACWSGAYVLLSILFARMPARRPR